MKFSINNVEFEIPIPPASELVFEGHQYVPIAYSPAKSGEVVYSIVKNQVLRRENDSKSPYWILRKVMTDEEKKKLEKDFDKAVQDIDPTDIIEKITLEEDQASKENEG